VAKARRYLKEVTEGDNETYTEMAERCLKLLDEEEAKNKK